MLDLSPSLSTTIFHTAQTIVVEIKHDFTNNCALRISNCELNSAFRILLNSQLSKLHTHKGFFSMTFTINRGVIFDEDSNTYDHIVFNCSLHRSQHGHEKEKLSPKL